MWLPISGNDECCGWIAGLIRDCLLIQTQLYRSLSRKPSGFLFPLSERAGHQSSVQALSSYSLVRWTNPKDQKSVFCDQILLVRSILNMVNIHVTFCSAEFCQTPFASCPATAGFWQCGRVLQHYLCEEKLCF